MTAITAATTLNMEKSVVIQNIPCQTVGKKRVRELEPMKRTLQTHFLSFASHIHIKVLSNTINIVSF